MNNQAKHCRLIFGEGLALLALVLVLTMLMSQRTRAQTLTVLHTFTGPDGAIPAAGVKLDSAGNLYGVTEDGGNQVCDFGCGTVYKLTHKNGGWILNQLYAFSGTTDGANPMAGVTLASNGSLYGTLPYSGPYNRGLVFNLMPTATAPRSALAPWNETMIHAFSGYPDGTEPDYDYLVFDQAGNLYGTTSDGGLHGDGTVFKMTPSNGGWTESVLYSFQGGAGDGVQPLSGVVLDASGNLYGTTFHGGPTNNGVVYKLSPSGSGWVEQVLYSFQNNGDGTGVSAGVVVDQAGNLYGATTLGHEGAEGTVYEISPSGGSWNFTTLHTFCCGGPGVGLTMDASGNLYGRKGKI